MESRQLGPLKVRIVGRGDGPVVVLLHGFGAPGDDLVPLAGALRAPPGTRFVFPEAPLDLAGLEGRAWWMIDLVRFQQAIATGAIRDLSGEVPEGLAEARRALGACLDQVEAEMMGSGEPLYLGGFSQGAMLVTDYILRTDRTVQGLALFSGTLLAAKEWMPLMAKRAGLRCVQSHGMMDPILPYPLAETLRKLLEDAGWNVKFVPFPGPHTIPPAALEAFSEVLRATP